MKKILVIEDEEDLNQTLSFNLENEGYKVTSALKGSEALEILENASPPVSYTHLRAQIELWVLNSVRMTTLLSHTALEN